MALFRIVTVSPLGYMHFKAFDEIKILLYYSLTELGHSVEVSNSFSEEAINIFFGAHLFEPEALQAAPADSIIFNTEQLASCAPEWAERILTLSRKYAIIDYSTTNLRWIEDAVNGRWEFRHERLRLGYHEKLERVISSEQKDVGFVFFGSITPYRQPILEKLSDSSKINLKSYFGFYGWARNSILARSRAALNLHSRSSRILEWPRLLFLVANRIPSVSLIHPQTIYDDIQIDYTYTCREDHAAEDLETLSGEFGTLSQFAQGAYARFREEKQINYTQAALENLFPDSSLPAPSPQQQPLRPAATAPKPLDERWYRLAYPWVDWDPRTIQDFHSCVGEYRQYHPNPSFRSQFKQPILLPHLLDAASLLSEPNNTSPPSDSLRIAVVLHFYDPRLAGRFFAEFAPSLAQIADFYITTSLAETAEICKSLALEIGVRNTQIKIIENIGRDIPSKYMVFNEATRDYDLCLYSHGKESDRAWFHDHNAMLAGSAATIQAILTLFASRPSLGLIFPDYMPHLISAINWSECRPMVDRLLSRFGCDTSSISLLEFPAGGFFWARPSALSPMHSLGLSLETLPPEPVPKNDTILHALERMPCLSCEMMGMEWEKLSSLG